MFLGLKWPLLALYPRYSKFNSLILTCGGHKTHLDPVERAQLTTSSCISTSTLFALRPHFPRAAGRSNETGITQACFCETWTLPTANLA